MNSNETKYVDYKQLLTSQKQSKLTENNETNFFDDEITVKIEFLHLIKTALDASSNGIVITDIEANIVWANKAFSNLTGYSKEEFSGKNTRLLKSGMHDEKFYKNIWETILNDKTWSGTIINKKKDNSFYYEEMTINPVKNKKGELTNFIAIKQDVTARKKIEKELIDSHYKFNKMIENSLLGILRLDENGEIIMANPAMLKMLNYTSQSELLNLNTENIYASLKSKNRFLQILKRNERIIGYEEILIKRDKSFVITKLSAWSVKDKNNSIIYYEVIIEDITEQKKNNQKLYESEFKYKILIDKLDEAIYLLIDNKIEIANEQFYNLFESDENEISNKNFELCEYVTDESRQVLIEREEKLNNDEDVPKKFLITIKTKTGTEKKVEISTSYLTFNDKIATQGVIKEIAG